MKILHLYPNLLNLYGEYGNVTCLVKHLNDQGIDTTVDKKDINDEYDFNDYDFIYCGSGLESNLMIALNDLRKHKDSLLKAINNNKLILFTGNAMELLGSSIDNQKALDLVSIVTKTTDKRLTGDVIVYNDEFGEIVGFINKSTIITNEDLFDYHFKDSNLKDDSTKEGYRINNLIGTHIIGPVLVKNPKLMNYFVKLLMEQNNISNYKHIDYPYEEDSYNVTLNALKERRDN